MDSRHLCADDVQKVVKFIGREACEAASGVVREDLDRLICQRSGLVSENTDG